jgi:hypothetical protein
VAGAQIGGRPWRSKIWVAADLVLPRVWEEGRGGGGGGGGGHGRGCGCVRTHVSMVSNPRCFSGGSWDVDEESNQAGKGTGKIAVCPFYFICWIRLLAF